MGISTSRLQRSGRDKRSQKDTYDIKNVPIKQIRILLLGTINSGKSTIAKQLLNGINRNGYSEEQKLLYKNIIIANIMWSMRAIIKAMKDFNLPFESEERFQDAEIVIVEAEKLDEVEMTDTLKNALKNLWNDEGVKLCAAHGNKYHLSESVLYYLGELDRICDSKYIPTVKDIFCSRVKTTGIFESTFHYKDLHFLLMDVGGVRGERKKPMQLYIGVSVIIYCVAVSEYDQALIEDENKNSMQESLKSFSSICNEPFYSSTPIILIFTKKDIFEQKISSSPLTRCFADYTGDHSSLQASEYIKKKFEDENKMSKVCTHFVNATETQNVRAVFDKIYDMMAEKNITSLS